MGGDFYVKSWGKLRELLESNCVVLNKVYNVKEVKLPTTMPFNVNSDHSKWSVTVNSSRPWTCIADMNREVSQESRGGGAVCTDNPAVWSAFSKIVITHEPCPNVTVNEM
ncbi:deoxyribonuclease-2-alpha-like [Alosa sapidissima]|uniref:deoxyribonuclease-2-alpha-like n=1 Tax=Alosa sapidissima TaxID=34773 RepID=UPI001C0947F3|nr:deoxyribonuclease-2-alpha-like [Alosa sapidissima]